MATKKPVPFADPARSCQCGYCSNVKVRAFIDGGLRAARDGGHPRPQKKTVADAVSAEFGTPENTVRRWLVKCCTPWTDPWPEGANG